MNPMQEWKAFCHLHECLPLSGRAVALWMELAWCNNRTFWSFRFTVSDALLRERLDVSQSTLIRARNELIGAGLLTIRKQKNGALNYHLPLPSERLAAWKQENTYTIGEEKSLPAETVDDLTACDSAAPQALSQADGEDPVKTDTPAAMVSPVEEGAIPPVTAPFQTPVTQGVTTPMTPPVTTGMTPPTTTPVTPPMTTGVTSASYYNKNKNKNENQNKNKESASAHPKGWRKDTLCFGEFRNVFLTKDEKKRLFSDYPALFPALLEEFSSALAARAYRYINHYAALCRWAARKTSDTSNTPKNATFSAVPQRQDYDIDAIRWRDIEQNMALYMACCEEEKQKHGTVSSASAPPPM